ncbi:MAG: hypothetical protein AAF385_16875 [Pseudomonadota bacterium]
MQEDTQIANALRELPELQPPEGQWQKILEKASDSSPVAERLPEQASRFGPWVALAAALLLAVVVIDQRGQAPEEKPVFSATPEPASEAALALRRQSQLLERLLKNSPPSPRVMMVGAASRRAAMEDRIAAIDQVLSENGQTLSATEEAMLWGERSALMKGLVRLRYNPSRSNTL